MSKVLEVGVEMPRSKRGANRVSALLNWFGRTRCKAEESWQSFSQCVAVFLVFPVKPTPPVLLHIVICDKQSRQSITLVTLCLTTSLISRGCVQKALTGGKTITPAFVTCSMFSRCIVLNGVSLPMNTNFRRSFNKTLAAHIIISES
jgi:hypothetical protein